MLKDGYHMTADGVIIIDQPIEAIYQDPDCCVFIVTTDGVIRLPKMVGEVRGSVRRNRAS